MGNILVKKYLRTFLTAVVLNFIWEMGQMPFFENMSFFDPDDWLLCFIAAISDGVIVLLIFLIGRLFFSTFYWPDRLTIGKITYLLVIGFTIATYFEITALRAGEWNYSQAMPLIPLLHTGVIPTLQMMLLPLLSYKLMVIIFPNLNMKQTEEY